MEAGKSRSYKDLVAWQKSIELAHKVYIFTRGFPKEEVYGLRQQARRSAVSIPSNIAEGQSRQGQREFGYFLGVANGSLAELQTQVILAEKFGFCTKEKTRAMLLDCDEIAKLLNGLIRSLLKTEN